MLLTIGYVLLAAAAVSLIIVVHEFGHFVCAKAVGMRVEVFSIGFWKRLVGFRIGETDYRVSLVPLGGYVKVSGESPEEGQGKPHEFWSKTPGQRALFVAGGVTMNVLLALLLFIVAFAIGVPFATARVGDVLAGEPAWLAGVQRGDRIVRINNVRDPVFDDVIRQVALRNQDKVRLEVERDGRLLSLSIKPKYDALRGARTIGVQPTAKPVVTGLGKVGGPDGTCPAEEAGIRLGDHILAVNGVPTPTGDDVYRQLLKYTDDEISVRLERGGRELSINVHTRPAEEYMLGISGVSATVEGIQPGGPAQAAGLGVGDRITAVNGQPVSCLVELDAALRQAHGPVTLGAVRGGRQVSLSADVPDALAAVDLLDSMVFESGPTLTWVKEGSPAYEAGMRPGDTIVSVAGKEVEDWPDVLLTGAQAGRDEREMQWRRNGETFTASLEPVLAQNGGGGQIGIEMRSPVTEARKYGAVSAIAHGLTDFRQTLKDIVISLQGMATHKVSPKTLGGIITIARISYQAAEMGIGKLIYLTAVLSASIAFLNILPVPVLDGGHLLFLAIEKLRGRRLSEKAMTIAQTVGFVLLMMLVVYVTRNDIMNWLRMG